MNSHNEQHPVGVVCGTSEMGLSRVCESPEVKPHNDRQERSYKVENGRNLASPPDRLATALRWAEKLKQERQTGFVYVIQAGDFIKIGVARDVRRRLALLQVGCPFNIELIAAIPCDEPYKAEAFLHDRLKPYHTRGEWFVAVRREVDEAVMALEAGV